MLWNLKSVAALVGAVFLVAGCAGSGVEPSPPVGAEDVESDDTEQTDTGDEPDDGPGATAEVPLADGGLEVHHFDVGQANATLLHHQHATILIDQGDWQRDDVVPYLRSVGVEQIDVIVTTHPHADHLGQFPEVLDALPVGEVWWSGAVTTSQTFERSLDALEASDVAYEEPRAGDVTEVGPLLVEVVGPDDDANFGDVHDSNLSMRITYGQVRFLFTGDAEVSTEARMVERHVGLLAADVYEVGHHGSSTSTTPVFLDAVDPAVSIYSAGAGNSYGHPHAQVLDRLTAHRTELYGTDVNGTVIVTSDGETFEVTTERDGAPVPGDGRAQGDSDDGDSDIEDAVSADASEHDHGDGSCTDGQTDLNSADVDELQQIVHVGPDRAGDIVSGRPFFSVSALSRLDGIGPARIDDIVSEGIACAS